MRYYLGISPPIPWERIEGRPELDRHLEDHRFWIRVCGPHDREADGPEQPDGIGWPWDEAMSEGPVDRVYMAHFLYPEPEEKDGLLTAQLQKFVDDFPEHAFTGHMDLHDEIDPVDRMRRAVVEGRTVKLQRPTVAWA